MCRKIIRNIVNTKTKIKVYCVKSNNNVSRANPIRKTAANIKACPKRKPQKKLENDKKQ